MYTLVYHRDVVRDDIPDLNGAWKKRIKGSIEAKLTTEPLLYGVPLRRDLHGCYKLRVGDYCVIYKVVKNEVQVIIIRHRRDVYLKNPSSRLD